MVVTRPWLSTDIFKARFWKFYDNSKKLSDGQIPPSGLYPAYVAALVFVRNLEIKLKPDSQKNSKAIETLKVKGGLNLGFFLATPSPEDAGAKKEFTLYNTRMIADAASYGVDTTATLTEMKSPLLTGAPASSLAGVERSVLAHSVNLAETKDADDKTKIAASKPSVSKLQLNNFMRMDIKKNANSTSTTDRKPSTPPTAQSSDDFMIMAFICKRLPMSPNPDQTLQW